MNSQPCIALIVLLALSGCQGTDVRSGETSSSPPPLPSALKQAFAGFDNLGFPDLSQSKYLETPQGDGFLLEDHGDTCTLFTGSLEARTVSKAPRTATCWIGDEVVEVHLETREVDVQSACAALLEESRTTLERGRDFPLGLRWTTRVELFLLGRVCYQQGYVETGRAAAQFALEAPPYRIDRRGHLSALEVLYEDFAHVAIWVAVLRFEYMSRQELLTRFRKFVNSYSGSGYVELAQEAVDILTRMVAEEKEREQRAPSPSNTQQRIEDLIFQLRDQTGSQMGAPGFCSVFEPPWIGEASTPAHLLSRYGYEAVPQLIEALDDARFSRAVGCHRPFYFSHYVLRVGDCALQVIERIADQRFFEPSSTFSYMTMDGKVAETKAKVLAWWESVQAEKR